MHFRSPRSLIGFSAGCVVVLTTVSILAQSAPLSPVSKPLITAMREGGLAAAASLVNHYVGSVEGDVGMSAYDLSELAADSAVVVRVSVARVVSLAQRRMRLG
jgi:hypothetical protein